MKILKSLVTLAAVIIIGIIVYFYVYKGEAKRKSRDAYEKSLIRFDLNKIKNFTLVRPDSSVFFERGSGEIWNIISPIRSEADLDPIFRLFKSLEQSDILFNVTDKTEDYSLYGLLQPEYYMAMEYEEGDPDTLFVGSITPDRTMSYVRFASEDRVLAVARQLTDIMKKPVIYYRSRTILNVRPEDITSIEIMRTQENESKIVLVSSGLMWVVMEPWKHPADMKNVGELLKKLSETKKSTLVEERTDNLSKYGLDDPTIIINISLKSGLPGKMLLIGKKKEGKNRLWYAKQFDKELIFTVDTGLLLILKRKFVWFIDRNPIRFNRNVINKITMKTTSEPVVFSKDISNNWSVISPIDKNISIETISKIFAISRYASVNELFSYNPSPEDIKKTGLDNPQISLNFYMDDKLLTQVNFGDSFTSEGQNTYFRTNLSPIIYITKAPINTNINNILNETLGN